LTRLIRSLALMTVIKNLGRHKVPGEVAEDIVGELENKCVVSGVVLPCAVS
jgi:hypothetical protein